ncbi:MAG: N-formylglutamate amidohydrolase [Pseudomonadota bacterium]
MLPTRPLSFPNGVLSADDPYPVAQEGPRLSQVLLACDHGGNAVPQRLALGVGEADLRRHIGYDIGAWGVTQRLGALLGAETIVQRFSRLVIDCNRPPSQPDAFPPRVDGSIIPGNVDLSAADAAARTAEIFHPYQGAVAAALDRRIEAGIGPVLVAVHSFTPFHGDYPEPRPWPICVLFDKAPEFSLALSAVLSADGTNVGENVPYQVGALGDYTIPVHGEARAIPHTLIEIRQDLIATDSGQAQWAKRLAVALPQALALTNERASNAAALERADPVPLPQP